MVRDDGWIAPPWRRLVRWSGERQSSGGLPLQAPRDDLSPISFGEPLLCGMADCEALTTDGLLERDGRLPGLFRLLPICPDCLHGLRTGQRPQLRAYRPDAQGDGAPIAAR